MECEALTSSGAVLSCAVRAPPGIRPWPGPLPSLSERGSRSVSVSLDALGKERNGQDLRSPCASRRFSHHDPLTSLPLSTRHLIVLPSSDSPWSWPADLWHVGHRRPGQQRSSLPRPGPAGCGLRHAWMSWNTAVLPFAAWRSHGSCLLPSAGHRSSPLCWSKKGPYSQGWAFHRHLHVPQDFLC